MMHLYTHPVWAYIYIKNLDALRCSSLLRDLGSMKLCVYLDNVNIYRPQSTNHYAKYNKQLLLLPHNIFQIIPKVSQMDEMTRMMDNHAFCAVYMGHFLLQTLFVKCKYCSFKHILPME